MRGLSEIIPIQDVYVSGLGAIEHVGGGNLRFVLYVNQENDDGQVEKVVVAKFIGPMSSLPEAVMKSVASLGEKLVGLMPMTAGDLLH